MNNGNLSDDGGGFTDPEVEISDNDSVSGEKKKKKRFSTLRRVLSAVRKDKDKDKEKSGNLSRSNSKQLGSTTSTHEPLETAKSAASSTDVVSDDHATTARRSHSDPTPPQLVSRSSMDSKRLSGEMKPSFPTLSGEHSGSLTGKGPLGSVKAQEELTKKRTSLLSRQGSSSRISLTSLDAKQSDDAPVKTHVLKVTLVEGIDMAIRDKTGTSDPYVVFKLGKNRYKSKTIMKNCNPKWNETFTFVAADVTETLHITAYDYDMGIGGDDFLGKAEVHLSSLQVGGNETMTLTLLDIESGQLCITLSLEEELIESKSASKRSQSKTASTKRSDSNPGSRKSRSGTLNVILLGGRNLLAMDEEGTSDPYVKFKFGSQKGKSKVVPKSLDPVWKEAFEFNLHEGADTLSLSVFDKDFLGKDDYMGEVDIPIESGSGSGRTIDKWYPLEKGGKGEIHLLLTVNLHDVDADTAEAQAALADTKNGPKLRSVGAVEVSVISAKDLRAADIGGTSDPYVIVALGNTMFRTETKYKTLNPEWNRTHTLNVRDVHAVLDVQVFDEDKNDSPDFLGRLQIPLLDVRPGPQWYALKSKNLLDRAKGMVQIDVKLTFDKLKAGYQSFQRLEVRYLVEEEKMSLKKLAANANRVYQVILFFMSVGNGLSDVLHWKNPKKTVIFWICYSFIILNFQVWYLPAMLATYFLYRRQVCDGRYSVTIDVNDLEDDDEESKGGKDKKDDKEQKSSLREKLAAIERVTKTVQSVLGTIASFCERVKNLFSWSVPFASATIVSLLLVITTLLMLIPLRYILFLYGIHKFTVHFRRSADYIDWNELFVFISRLPSDVDLVHRRPPIDKKK
eukprot:Opistho-2@4987